MRLRFSPSIAGLLLVLLMLIPGVTILAHPLGNFTINHFIHLDIETNQLTVFYVLDMAEIPTFQERSIIDLDNDGQLSASEIDNYAQRIAQNLAENLVININETQTPLTVLDKKFSLLPGAGGLSTMRLECHFQSKFINSSTANHLYIEDRNHAGRLGWREMFATSQAGVALFNSTIYGNSVTDALKVYPTNLIAAPLNEQRGEMTFAALAPPGSHPLRLRNGQPIVAQTDKFMELIAVPNLTPKVVVLGLLLAILLGGFHALSPGHGKTIVGAYLVGSRGTTWHAIMLGLTVTITHTIGVFLLGLITLFASHYILPERIFPLLSLLSGGIVIAIGLSLFIHRLLGVLGYRKAAPDHSHTPSELTGSTAHSHSHGFGGEHTHYLPDMDSQSTTVSWRSLLALGISGGLLPCPSALVVLLSAISLHRIGYGLLLVVAFSLGLAGALTAVGLLFLYAKRLINRPLLSSPRLINLLPVFSALIISLIGMAICFETLRQFDFASFWTSFRV